MKIPLLPNETPVDAVKRIVQCDVKLSASGALELENDRHFCLLPFKVDNNIISISIPGTFLEKYYKGLKDER